MYLRLGCFQGFMGRDSVLLISGDQEGLLELAMRLRRLEDRDSGPLEVNNLPFVQAYQDVYLVAYPVDVELGVRRMQFETSEPRFTWHHSQEGWLEAAEKIEAVADGSGGHNDLGAIGVEDAIVMVSKGEYDIAWWEKHS